MRQPRFHAGDFSTDFIAEEWRPESFTGQPAPSTEGSELSAEQVAALVGALLARDHVAGAEIRRRDVAGGAQQEEGWRWRLGGRKTASSGW
jgi:hypothetical protein